MLYSENIKGLEKENYATVMLMENWKYVIEEY